MPQKAVIEVLDGEADPKEIEVMFNPESYQISYGASYRDWTDRSVSILQGRA